MDEAQVRRSVPTDCHYHPIESNVTTTLIEELSSYLNSGRVGRGNGQRFFYSQAYPTATVNIFGKEILLQLLYNVDKEALNSLVRGLRDKLKEMSPAYVCMAL